MIVVTGERDHDVLASSRSMAPREYLDVSPLRRATPPVAARVLLAWLACLVPLSCTGATAPATPVAHDAAVADQGDRAAALCAHYQALATSRSSFDVVQQIFDDSCASCHTGAALDLSAGRAWSDLVNHAPPADEACGRTLVVPGDPASSYLYQKLTSPHPCAGRQMPLDELFGSAPLPDCVTGLIRAWIEAGAPPSALDGGGLEGGG